MNRFWIVMFAVFLVGCSAVNSNNGGTDAPAVPTPARFAQVDSLGWLGPDTTYADNRTPDFSVATDEPIRLNFFGWSPDDDYRFHLQFPANTAEYGLAQLSPTPCVHGETDLPIGT